MIDHIAVVVEDPKKTAEVLVKFGYEIFRETVHHGGSVEVFDPKQEGLIIELCTKRPQDTVGLNHVCVRLGQEEYDKLEAEGMKFSGELHLSKESGRYVNNYVDDDKIKWQITI